ncbi:NADH dehydrogenase [ubiquinone] 1 alpha subcomplex subunit 2-like [Chlorella sorokiniana]|uniref:NADH dehydrogenase [ubiquinone] 1 alpha subcomplex subunit 2-like n=1 Tax=Chlorella sorokiniana TaxID=3076 RepID=A0A2P6TF52_CHLSO|nr:NADH dehydrogenase [ubiquinone] 1 alpha subcomplex subunit 2-like [Chlorella sorokiniana]|eukprot:PRW32601.1 NADH dehydrogenase [ubiquinone] 1 alpha subcomplex subunit 2-like [Chlorella sorokiniana]
MAWRGALSKNLQELRIHLCQTGKGSQGARDFVLSSYQELKKANPTFPILVRECSGVEAKLIARYDYGVEEAVKVDGLSKADITKQLEALVKKGESMPRSAESEGKL